MSRRGGHVRILEANLRRNRSRGYNRPCRRRLARAATFAVESPLWTPNLTDEALNPRDSGPDRRRIVVLGSTGSIGVNTLDVALHLSDRICVHGLGVHSSLSLLVEQAQRHRPRAVAIADPDAAAELDESALPIGTRLLVGDDSIQQLASDPDADIVVSAIVGAAGLAGTWAALDAGKTVALANKETLVVAGQLVMELSRKRRAPIVPVDSEHSAIHQALAGKCTSQVRRLVLTASGGPFRGKSRDQLAEVTPEEALNHPTWQMGKKISIDSATMMNKALEIIEARWLFDLPPEKIDVIVHPESLVHSFVEFVDGSVIAQMSPPDMRLPIQYALSCPDHWNGPAHRLDWTRLSTIHFEPPDRVAFPALDLGYEVARSGGTCGAVLNAANEVAVSRFLKGELPFLDIVRACREVLNNHNFQASPTLDELWGADRWARHEVTKWKATKTSMTCA